MKKIYLDHAAATPIDPRAIKAMEPYFAEQFYNPSALYLDAKSVAHDIADARSRVAGWLGVRPGEIIFTAGGTEANNLAVQGVMAAFPDSNLLVSSIEHESVLKPAQNYAYKEIPVDNQGQVNLGALEKLVDAKTVLVSVMYANNEIGTIQSIKRVSDLLAKLRKARKQEGNNLPLYLHTDACQAANYLDLHTSRLGVDLMTLNGGKIYGPKQSGALFVSAGVQLKPLILGGGQELGQRSGTENVPAIIGFAQAFDLAQKQRHVETKRLQDLQKLFLKLLDEKLPDAAVNGSLKHRLPNNIHVTISGQDNERLIMALDEAGIQAAAGSACSASNEEPSHVLKAIGLSEDEAQSSLRFTMGRTTSEDDVRHVVETLCKLVA